MTRSVLELVFKEKSPSDVEGRVDIFCEDLRKSFVNRGCFFDSCTKGKHVFVARLGWSEESITRWRVGASGSHVALFFSRLTTWNDEIQGDERFQRSVIEIKTVSSELQIPIAGVVQGNVNTWTIKTGVGRIFSQLFVI